MTADRDRWRAYNRQKQAEYRRARGIRPRPVVRCATPQGYRRHIRRHEPTCHECRLAWSAYIRSRRQLPVDNVDVEDLVVQDVEDQDVEVVEVVEVVDVEDDQG